MGRALDCNVGELTSAEQLDIPRDKELRETVERIIVRAKKYFR